MSSAHTPTTPSTPMPSSTAPLQPTWFGFVQDTREALILFEAVLQGALHRVTRRPHDRERASLIRSGSVFIYEEGASGIKRWTDGVSWSPSRILNNFLIYRELEKPFPPGEKKRAKPKVKPPPATDEVGIKQEGVDGITSPMTPSSATSPSVKQEEQKDSKRALVGSLTESYNFKDPGGLVKKTMSVVVGGSHFHLVSYYDPEDVEQNKLDRPINTNLKYIRVRNELVHRQNFRAPIDETDEGGMQVSPSWAQQSQHQQHPYLPAGATSSHAAFLQQQQQDYMQRSGQSMANAMSPQSPSYPAHWSQQQDPRTAYDQRYPMSAPSPVQAQNPFMAQMSQMPPSLQMRTDFSNYSSPSYGGDRYQQYQDQQPQQNSSQPHMSPYGQHYPGHSSPMQPSPGSHAWPSR